MISGTRNKFIFYEIYNLDIDNDFFLSSRSLRLLKYDFINVNTKLLNLLESYLGVKSHCFQIISFM